MTRHIQTDHKHFRDVIAGRLRKELQKFISTRRFVRKRAKGGKMTINIPQIDIPHFVYGDGNDGIGRGAGKEGDVIGRDPAEGDGNGAGQGEGEGIEINLDLDYVLKFLKEDLELPDLQPKQTPTFEEIKIKYNDIALAGPESLRHNRRTLLQALKRQAATGELEKLHYLPGFVDPVKLITPINSDRRYRQYKEIKIPSSNAVIMFGRDGSASMDQTKCDIISDMAWWIDVWIRKYYEKVERCYFWHDTAAQEVDEEKFYKYRFGGGTTCSSCLNLMAKQFETRFPPDKWNIYCFYFSDGENWAGDNAVFLDALRKQFPPGVCNLFGVTQIMAWHYDGSLKQYVQNNMDKEMTNLRLVSIGEETTPDYSTIGWHTPPPMSDEDLDKAKVDAIKFLLGKNNVKA